MKKKVVAIDCGFDTKEYDSELMLDVDYILEQIKPVTLDKYYSFFIAAATVVFTVVRDIETDIAIKKKCLGAYAHTRHTARESAKY